MATNLGAQSSKAEASSVRHGAIIDPSRGVEIGRISLASKADVDAAVAAAKAAFPAWSGLGLQHRINIMLDLRQSIVEARDELIEIVIAETGKTRTDATVEVTRAIEVIGNAVNVSTLFAAPYTRGVSAGVDTYEVRYPVGIVAAISPFNFPVIIPLVQSMSAIACGNTVVVKPSERNPSALLRVAELFAKAGLPDGVFNVILGDRVAVDRIVEHPDIAAITFVGSTSVARQIRARGVANNKRVQAFGGGKNHMVVMPDCDIGFAADAAVSAAYDLGNGATIFTRDGALANRFTDEAPAGQIGINVPIPAPVYFHGFAGWKESAFTETKLHGRDAIAFFTKSKTVSARWVQTAASKIELHFPSSR